MGGQNPVARNETQALDLALSGQEPVERIARRRFWMDGRNRVPMNNHKQVNADRLEIGRHLVKRQKRIEFSEPSLDGDLPDTGCAGKCRILFGVHYG